MRLIELSANQSTFKTVSFKRQGLNIICGAKNNPSDTSTNKTFNGVGKSLLMNIVNFCLGSNKIEQFESKIPDWVFTLKFEVDGEIHVVKRSTKQQSKINLNGKDVILKVYKKHLEELCFGGPLEIPDLSFRTLIYRFLRVDKKSSQLWNDFSPDKSEYHKLLRTGFLLGIDPKIIAKKKELRSEYKKIEDDRDRLEKDEVFKKFFLEGEDVEIEISALKEKVEKKQTRLKDLKVAEDYREIEYQTQNLRKEQSRMNNKIILIKNKIKNIQEALKLKADVSAQQVIEMYERASVEVPGLLKQDLKEVSAFHRDIIEGRTKRLSNEKKQLSEQLKQLEDQVEIVDGNLDKKLQYLGAHGALDEYDALKSALNEEENHLSRLETFQKLTDEYRKSLGKKKVEIDTQNNSAIDYLQDTKDIRETNNRLFRGLAKRFYPEATECGISIKENTGENQIQFDINAKIDFDTSDGIGEIKIICFDLMMLLKQHNHQIKFLFHDSRLFSDVDPRQVSVLLETIVQLSKEYDFQYIMTINQNTLDSIKVDQYLSEDDFNEIVESDNKRLTLTDESAESKLLGIDVKMNYEK